MSRLDANENRLFGDFDCDSRSGDDPATGFGGDEPVTRLVIAFRRFIFRMMCLDDDEHSYCSSSLSDTGCTELVHIKQFLPVSNNKHPVSRLSCSVS